MEVAVAVAPGVVVASSHPPIAPATPMMRLQSTTPSIKLTQLVKGRGLQLDYELEPFELVR